MRARETVGETPGGSDCKPEDDRRVAESLSSCSDEEPRVLTGNNACKVPSSASVHWQSVGGNLRSTVCQGTNNVNENWGWYFLELFSKERYASVTMWSLECVVAGCARARCLTNSALGRCGRSRNGGMSGKNVS